MSWFSRKWKIPLTPSKVPPQAAASPDAAAADFDRLRWFEDQLRGNAEARFEEITYPPGYTCRLIFIDGIVDHLLLQQFVLPALTRRDAVVSCGMWLQDVKRELTGSVEAASGLPQALGSVLEGDAALLFEGVPEILMAKIRKVEKRQIAEPDNEPTIRGPKEAFVEDIQTNMALLRKRIKHPDLKTEQLSFGKYTKTSIALVYINSICKKELVDEVRTRLSRIDMDGMLGSSYVEEFIEDNPFSPFPQVQYTERPDTMAAALLEGRLAILVDGTPMQLIVPVTLYMLLQSAEDYYQRYIASTWIRWIRYIFLLVAFFLPSTYIAITTFHPEMLPPNLLMTVAAARENVPFPAIVEAMLMEISFEAIREAGLRIPKPIGQTVSIIGALVIGQAAVQAGIVSAPMLIVVAITGISSFLIPHFDLALSIRLLRFPVMMMAASFGLFGIIISILWIYLHLVSMRSFGTPYLSPTAPLVGSDWKDVMYRAPWWSMKRRPRLFGTMNRTRMNPPNKPQFPDDDGD